MDYISNLLTSIRNAEMASHTSVTIPASKMGENILAILKSSGYITGYTVKDAKPQNVIEVGLLRPRTVHHLRRISKPGRRVYVGAGEIPTVLNGLGIAILSTSAGVLSNKEARKRKIGGELLCDIY